MRYAYSAFTFSGRSSDRRLEPLTRSVRKERLALRDEAPAAAPSAAPSTLPSARCAPAGGGARDEVGAVDVEAADAQPLGRRFQRVAHARDEHRLRRRRPGRAGPPGRIARAVRRPPRRSTASVPKSRRFGACRRAARTGELGDEGGEAARAAPRRSRSTLCPAQSSGTSAERRAPAATSRRASPSSQSRSPAARSAVDVYTPSELDAVVVERLNCWKYWWSRRLAQLARQEPPRRWRRCQRAPRFEHRLLLEAEAVKSGSARRWRR